jgi:peptide/nickel transport system substrate-binding protein
MRTVLAGVVAALLAGSSALAQSQLLFLAEDVPAGLDYDGPSVSTNTSQTGFINLSEPLIYYPYGPTNAEGVRTLDYSKYEGRLVERWEFDEPSLTWTFHVRKGVKSCAGNEFTADDVIYTFERAEPNHPLRRAS